MLWIIEHRDHLWIINVSAAFLALSISLGGSSISPYSQLMLALENVARKLP
jgi:hypothetical protein